MAYLIAESGRWDIVDLVAKSMNNATVIQLSVDPVIGPILRSWLRDVGLSVAEAQRIQPAYEYVALEDPEEVSSSFAISSAALGSLCLVATAVNASASQGNGLPRWVSQVGLGLGTATVIVGGSNVDAGGARRALATVDIAIGAAAVITSGWALIARDTPNHADRPREERAAIAPTARWIKDAGPGIGIRMRF
jgi:hypothetical protein